uniref:RING-CH-type domain-containing protein n=1 Tax=Chlamydomonas euryale TaxID=1486919 RepID=A0A7R9VGA6_9CHLO|mmetsp:Transcript_33526/g.99811  ORF Transcript_33526/g.99811 Transcript_33526/m.99811 type:complete len:443 (+) Transcript_33526:402-1730(+)
MEARGVADAGPGVPASTSPGNGGKEREPQEAISQAPASAADESKPLLPTSSGQACCGESSAAPEGDKGEAAGGSSQAGPPPRHGQAQGLPAAEPEPSPGTSDDAPKPPPNLNGRNERKLCRFCLADEQEEPELGALFTPCLCRDTVHQECLRKWRATNSAAFYSCNVCKWQYRFKTLSAGSEFGLRLCILLWPVVTTLLLSLLLGLIPIAGPSDTLGMRILNGLSVLGLIYLAVIAAVFNFQYCRAALAAAQQSAVGMGMPSLPTSIYVQLVLYLAMRCFLVGLFFVFCVAVFFPFSAFMGLVVLIMAWPPALKELGDRIVRHLEFRAPVMQVTPGMEREAAAAAAQQAQQEAAERTTEEQRTGLEAPAPPSAAVPPGPQPLETHTQQRQLLLPFSAARSDTRSAGAASGSRDFASRADSFRTRTSEDSDHVALDVVRLTRV